MCLSIFKSNNSYCTIASLFVKEIVNLKYINMLSEKLLPHTKKYIKVWIWFTKQKNVWMKIEWMNEWMGMEEIEVVNMCVTL